jgi:hypothetical protein
MEGLWMTRLIGYLYRLAPNFLLVASGVVLGWALFSGFPARSTADLKRYHQGDKAPSIAEFNYRDAPVTVLLFLSTHCRFCQESVPFYQRMAALPNVASGRARVIGVFDEDGPIASDYLARAGLAILPTARVGAQDWVSATPTLIVVRNTGKVELSAVGKLTSASEESLLRLVTALAQ